MVGTQARKARFEQLSGAGTMRLSLLSPVDGGGSGNTCD